MPVGDGNRTQPRSAPGSDSVSRHRGSCSWRLVGVQDEEQEVRVGREGRELVGKQLASCWQHREPIIGAVWAALLPQGTRAALATRV